MNKQRIIISLGIVCIASLCSCSHNEETEDANQPVELGIKTSIALTRAVETGEAFTDGQYIAVYANSTTTNTTTNNYAVYTYASNAWGASGSNKIYLSAEPATIYAHYPAYSGTGTSTPLTVNNYNSGSGVTTSSTVNVSTFEGVTTGADDNNKITITGSSNTNDINAAPGETDYMYATKPNDTSQPQASNGKSTAPYSALTKSVNLQMNHALTMVSFRIYKDANYHNTGKLTKIELKNASGTTPLSKAGTGNTTMNISTGAITLPSGNQEAAVYTRYIYQNSDAGYTIQEAPSGSNPENSPAFSILVFPVASISTNAIKVTFTIDDTPYEISIPSSGSSTGWKAGNNNIYKVTMNSIGLEIGTVTIKQWNNQTTVDGGNLV